jgi:hypothetical protein
MLRIIDENVEKMDLYVYDYEQKQYTLKRKKVEKTQVKD